MTNRTQYFRQYRIDNLDKSKERFKKYWDTNNDKLKTTIVCDCLGKYTIPNKSTHIKTNKHTKWLENIENQ